ncbi:MAG: O-antigen ligase family protein [Gallionellaceae bacterium]|jgi:hypothetical protein
MFYQRITSFYNNKMNKNYYWSFASLIFCAALYLIWPLAHTIALRKVLLLISACIGIALWVRCDDRFAILKSTWLQLLGLLLAWVLFHAGFLSQNGAEAWDEFAGQWLPAYLAILAGIGLGLASRNIDPDIFKGYLLLILAAQPVLFLLYSTYESIQLGRLTGFYVGQFGTDLKTSLTFSSDMVAALACYKFLESFNSEVQNRRKYLWLLPVVLALFVAIFSSSTNSILLIIGCFISMIALLGYKLNIRLSMGGITGVILLAAISIYAVSYTPAVENKIKGMISNTKVSANIDTYQNWTNFQKFGLPRNELGEQLGESFYLRVAYAKAGLRAILEHPWGYGVTRQAFERLIKQKHPDASIANAHNGYLNLSSAVGIPGLLLFVFALVAIFMQLHRSNSEYAGPATWMIGIYAVHWITDALERDHFFESYLFVIALLLTLVVNKTAKETYA